ncbi:hypothetical protein [Lactiplantibacillus mudanjiangensis]|uniref:hypothetical protein n=1 Tax=Lactiplantibacillus mudanjiangensis TaxID=1296538 RepID=UPI0013EF08C1
MLIGLICLMITTHEWPLLGIVGCSVIFNIGRTMNFGNTSTATMQHITKSAQPDLNALYSTWTTTCRINRHNV